MTDHTPIQCVTIPGLMASRAALRRLLIETETRIRDELAKECGLSPYIQVQCEGALLWVEKIVLTIKDNKPELVLECLEDTDRTRARFVFWNPDTCTVVEKGEPG